MEKLRPEFRQELLADIDEGKEKAEIIDKLLDEDYSLFDAEGLYRELKQECEDLQRRKPKRKETLWQKLKKPKFVVTALAFLTGGVLPYLFSIANPLFLAIYLGISWMMHVFGHWFSCLVSGNLPGTFIAREGVMYPKCIAIGQNSNITLSFPAIGGILFSLVVGSLLVIYMVHLAKKTYHDLDLDADRKRLKYLAAWFNGTIGLQSLFMAGSSLVAGSGELRLDIIDISQALHFSEITVTLAFFWTFMVVALVTVAVVLVMLLQDKRA